MGKEISLHELISELIQNDNSLVNQYNNKQENFPDSVIDSSSEDQLDREYSIIKWLLQKFQVNYRQLFKIAIKESTTQNDRITARTYLEISGLYLNIIQNLYLNPINYRLNKLNSEKSLKKANLSICVGIASILLGLLISLFNSFSQNSCFYNTTDYNRTEETQIIEKIDSCKIENELETIE